MKDTLTLRCLLQALQNFVEAEREEQDQRSAYLGYSWDYFGQDYIQRREDAAAEFGKRLDEYIDRRIAAATGSAP